MTARCEHFETVIAFPMTQGKRIEIPVNLLPMAACVARQGISIPRVVDGESLRLHPPELVEESMKNRPNIFGLSVYTPALPFALEAAHIAKNQRPEVVTVLGGKHATIFYQELLVHSDVDVVCVGEGEEILPRIVAARSQGGIEYMKTVLRGMQGIAFRGDRNVLLAPDVDLRTLPRSNYSFLQPPLEFYLKQEGLIIDMESARGCFGKCSFCIAAKYRKGMGFKDPQQFIDEIEYVTAMHKGPIYLTDDDFMANYHHTKEVVQELIKHNIHAHIESNVRADSFLKCVNRDPNILQEFKEGGIEVLHIGVESANPAIAEYCKRNIRLDDIEKTVKLGTEAGLIMVTNFIVGFPYDTEETIHDSIRFAERLKRFGPHLVHVSIFMPYPGTEMYDDAVDEGLLDPRVFSLESLSDVHTGAVIPTKYLESAQVDALYNEFYDSFYTSSYMRNLMQFAPQVYPVATYMAKKRLRNL